MKTRYSVFGLGKLGACTAACIASKGFDVIGVDVNENVIGAINDGIAPVSESGLTDLMLKAKNHLSATRSYEDAILNSDVSLIIVPTPSESHGGFSLRYVSAAVSGIGKCLAEKPDYHLVDIVSTVLPGSTEFGIKQILEKESEKKCAHDFGLCYNPEFIALGTVIRDFLNPDFVLIGESDERAGKLLESCYKSFCDNNPPVHRMNIISAEVAKISLNTYVTTKITFSNMLAELCEQIPGADVDIITQAIGLDKRIGRKYLNAGLGYGGPCFPRDNVALGYVARQLGTKALIAETTDKVNNDVLRGLRKLVKTRFENGYKVGILGISYKPNSNVVEESQGFLLAQILSEDYMDVIVYDPLVTSDPILEKSENITIADSWKQVLSESDIVVIANPDPEFQKIKADDFRSSGSRKIIIDCWRLFRNTLSDDPEVDYLPLGIGKDDPNLIERLKNIVSDLA